MSGRQKLNKAVRQLPGGSETLDAAELFAHIVAHQTSGSEVHKVATLARDRIQRIADAMRDQVSEWRKEE